MSSVVVITGSRDWPEAHYPFVIAKLREHWLLNDTIISGGARGIDTLAHEAALAWGMGTCVIEADWKLYGRAHAGRIRNGQMLDLIQWPRLVLAFHWLASPGTADCITQALARHLTIVRYTERDVLPVEPVLLR